MSWYHVSAMPVDSNAGFHPILAHAATEQASDIHLMAGQPPIFRLHGKLKLIDTMPVYTAETLLAHLDQVLSKELQARFRAERELDTSLVLGTGERFRVNALWEKGNPAVALRFIPAVIPTLDDLLAPEAAYDFVNMNYGLVCVTGTQSSSSLCQPNPRTEPECVSSRAHHQEPCRQTTSCLPKHLLR